MKNLFLTLALIITSLFTLAKAENIQTVKKNIPVKLVETIEIKGSSKVIYIQGEKTEVVVRGDKELVNLIVIENKGNRLIVSQKSQADHAFNTFFKQLKNGFKENKSPVIYVTSPDLIGVTLTGSGDFIANGKVDTDNLEIKLTGSGDIDFNEVICDNVHAWMQGSGDVRLKNITSINAKYELEGSGDISVKQQRVRKTDLNLYGSGDIKVYCTQCGEVNAKLTGSGDINVYGDVETKTQMVRGSGDIEFH